MIITLEHLSNKIGLIKKILKCSTFMQSDLYIGKRTGSPGVDNMCR